MFFDVSEHNTSDQGESGSSSARRQNRSRISSPLSHGYHGKSKLGAAAAAATAAAAAALDKPKEW